MQVKHDKDRLKRCGIPEVVFGAGKSAEDLVLISQGFLKDLGRVIITKVDAVKAAEVKKSAGQAYKAVHNEKGQVLVLKDKKCKPANVGTVGVLSAGTSDIPIAEEACAIAEELGCKVLREYDVGIAGLHRVFSALESLKKADLFIVVAGMEGALPSVVAGLVPEPVIAVPTSVGYGTSEKGKAALYTMLNSCTPLAVVNIDNGYGAAVLAYKILSMRK